MDSQATYALVKGHYSSVASKDSEGAYGKSVAQSFGYSLEDLDSIPAQSNLGLSCGNPLAIASLKEGETVIDLGSGAGFDVFLASKRVGQTGRAIGVDMNKDMLALAQKNMVVSGATNAEFVEGRITSIPLDDGIADAIISNCVINLVPDQEKQQVFHEIFRLLKPGGRVALSDILAKRSLPENVRASASAYVGCIAGASLVDQYRAYFKHAGFSDVIIKDANNDLNVYSDTLPDGSKRTASQQAGNQLSATCRPPMSSVDTASCCSEKRTGTGQSRDIGELGPELEGIDLNEWVGSYKIFAVKP
ncbi:NAD(P)-binding protein [Thozetella sp. PMI_491]|nr:NAD(P)-binding protein [Thozetella sp. PMI_491]